MNVQETLPVRLRFAKGRCLHHERFMPCRACIIVIINSFRRYSASLGRNERKKKKDIIMYIHVYTIIAKNKIMKFAQLPVRHVGNSSLLARETFEKQL